jgi:single-strand DNA-binding protein
MLNQVVLVGRLVRDPELIETESNKKMTRVTIAIPRSFKNVNGEYESDFINCILWDAVAKSTVEYCHKGDIVGTKSKRYTLYKPLFIRYRNRVIVFVIDNPIK